MMTSYHDNAKDFERWAEKVDPMGTMTEAEFNEMSMDDKIRLQVECFGGEDFLDELIDEVGMGFEDMGPCSSVCVVQDVGRYRLYDDYADVTVDFDTAWVALEACRVVDELERYKTFWAEVSS
jgi:hypothetical protein